MRRAASTALLLLHGSGDTGANLREHLCAAGLLVSAGGEVASLASHLAARGCVLVCPTAPTQPYSPEGGERAHVWFDRSARWMQLGRAAPEHALSTDASLTRVAEQLQKMSGEYEHVFVGGFSMGGGLALHLLRHPLPANVRGIFSMGSFLAEDSRVLTDALDPHSAALPVLMMHGEADDLIPLAWGRASATALLRCGVDASFRSFARVRHEMSEAELAQLLLWMDELRADEPEPVPEPMDAVAEGRSPEGGFPFALTELGDGRCLARFLVPAAAEEYLIARPVLCRGGVFDLAAHPSGGVSATFTSSSAADAAAEISVRLFNRWHGQSSDVNPCQTS